MKKMSYSQLKVGMYVSLGNDVGKVVSFWYRSNVCAQERFTLETVRGAIAVFKAPLDGVVTVMDQD